MIYFVLCDGKKFLPYLYVFLESFQKHHEKSNDKLFVIFSNIGNEEIELLISTYAFINPVTVRTAEEKKIRYEVTASFKFEGYYEGIKSLNFEDKKKNIVFLDADFLINANISNKLYEVFRSNVTDCAFTSKFHEKNKINLGFCFFKNFEIAEEFIKYMISELDNIVQTNKINFSIKMAGALDQYIVCLLTKVKNLKNDDYYRIFNFQINKKNFTFLFLECEKFNQTNSIPVNNETYIFHYKSKMRPVILGDGQYNKVRTEKKTKAMYDYWNAHLCDSIKKILENYVIKIFRDFIKNFSMPLNFTFKESPTGIKFFEFLVIIAVIKKYKIDCVIESGTGEGNSAELFAKFLNIETEIHSIDIKKKQNTEERLKNYKNLKFYHGNSKKLLPKIIEKTRKKNIAIFIDGPKGEEALNLGGMILSKFKNKIKLIVFDDVNKVALGKSNYTRYLIDKYFDRIFFTDSKKIVEEIKVFKTKNSNLINNNILILDNFVGNYKKGFYYSGSYLNGMAIIFPTERDYHRLSIKFNYFYKLKNFLKKFKEKFF